ncbi:MAG: amino acid permease [Ignavibacteriales bacterium]|nr:amino acid permease [Ignavibacteriales bacterium]
MSQQAPIRQLGTLQSFSIITGAVIGSGVFINLPLVAMYGGSPLRAVLIWFIGGLLWLPQILILAEMGTAYPDQGGPYQFINKAGSPLLAFLYTWTAFLTSDTPTLTIIALSAASALKYFFPVLGDAVWAKCFAASLIVILAALQYRSVKTGGNVQVFLTIAKLLPLAALVAIGVWYLGSGNLFWKANPTTASQQSPWLSLTAGISATLWAYAGFLNILYMGGEVKDPSRTLPRSLIGSLVFVTVSYVLISLCAGAIVPHAVMVASQGEFVNPFAYMQFFSHYAGAFFAVVAFVSMIGALNSTIMTQPRLEYAMAKDGLFFAPFGKLHPRFLTPHVSIVIQAAIAILLFTLGNIETLLGYFTLSYVLQNALVYGAIFWLRRKESYKPIYKVRSWRWMAVLAIASQLFIAGGALLAFPPAGLIACAILIASGILVYWYFHSQHQSKAVS